MTAERRDQPVLLTGATGFLGSHIMAALLENDQHVIITGRSKQKESLSHRIRKSLRWFGLEHKSPLVTLMEADFLKPACGLSESEVRMITDQKPVFIHCASDTRFSACHRKEIFSANVEALSELLKLAIQAEIPAFHYVSTAYASGNQAVCGEVQKGEGIYVNVYEESKAEAEQMVMQTLEPPGIPYSIIRPSIVYGNSCNGRSNSFNALYSHVKALYFLKEIYLKDIRKNKGKRAAECGIRFDSHGKLEMPLNLFLPADGKINLLPVDYFVSAVMAILQNFESGNIYNVTSDQPKLFSELADWCERFLDFRGIHIHFGEKQNDFIFSPAENLFNNFIEPYLPYLSDHRSFEHENLTSIYPVPPPELTYEVFHRCMEYAVKVKWVMKSDEG